MKEWCRNWSGVSQYPSLASRPVVSVCVGYLWPWSPPAPTAEAGRGVRCRAASHLPPLWWTPARGGSRSMALLGETKHSRCHGNCVLSAGTRVPQTEPGTGIYDMHIGNQKLLLKTVWVSGFVHMLLDWPGPERKKNTKTKMFVVVIHCGFTQPWIVQLTYMPVPGTFN